VIGCLIAVFVNLASPYTESVGFSNFSWSYLPEGGVAPFLLVLVASAAVARFSQRLGLSRRELCLIFIMALVSNCTSIFLVYFWLAAIASPYYFASPENRWATDLMPHMPSWLVVSDRNHAALWFYEGVPVGERLPWRDWAGPALAWMPLLAAVLLACYVLAAVFRRQWLDHEKLRYPLMQLPLELLPAPGAAEAPVWRRLPFWVALLLPFLASVSEAIRRFVPAFPAITVDHLGSLSWPSVRFSPHFPDLAMCVNPLALGVGFFVPTDVLLSVWVMYLLVKILEVGVLTRLGIDTGSAGMFVWGSAAAAWQSFGAACVLIGGTLWSARRHLRGYWQAATRGRPSPPDELMSPRSAVLLLALALVVMGVWLGYSRMPPLVIAVFVPMVLLFYLYLARVICQSGVFYLVPPQIAQNVCIALFGPRGVGRDGMISLGLSYSWHGDVQTVLSALAAESVQVQRHGGVTGREMSLGVLLSVALGLVVAPLGIIWLGNRQGAVTWPTWVFKGWGPNTYGQVLGQIGMPGSFDPRPAIFALVGAVLMAALTSLNHRFAWWPIHPLGLAVASSFTIYAVYIAFLLAWLVKVMVLRWGGVNTYRRMVPFFIGLTVGHYAGRAVLLTVNALLSRAWTV
jgi:Family of unknown function (DUF6785)/Domain of unknown function (DUF6784)